MPFSRAGQGRNVAGEHGNWLSSVWYVFDTSKPQIRKPNYFKGYVPLKKKKQKPQTGTNTMTKEFSFEFHRGHFNINQERHTFWLLDHPFFIFFCGEGNSPGNQWCSDINNTCYARQRHSKLIPSKHLEKHNKMLHFKTFLLWHI